MAASRVEDALLKIGKFEDGKISVAKESERFKGYRLSLHEARSE
jgi:hypothetical protein